MQYDLRKLLILMAVVPPTAVGTWFAAPYVLGALAWGLARLLGITC